MRYVRSLWIVAFFAALSACSDEVLPLPYPADAANDRTASDGSASRADADAGSTSTPDASAPSTETDEGSIETDDGSSETGAAADSDDTDGGGD